eukprot:8295067-Pyramimonas_sp.AAC.1
MGRFSKPMATIQMAPPDDSDQPPTLQELCALQGHAGKLNWLSTRMRPDLSYWTSVIASATNRYASWTLALCRKVLRYLVGTVEQMTEVQLSWE